MPSRRWVTIRIASAANGRHLSYPLGRALQGRPIDPVRPHTTGVTGRYRYRATGLPRGLHIDARTGVITGRESPGTEERAKNLGMTYAYQGFLSKLKPLRQILAATGLKEENVAYMGDDWTDIPVLKRAGLACSPANGLEEVKRIGGERGQAPARGAGSFQTPEQAKEHAVGSEAS